MKSIISLSIVFLFAFMGHAQMAPNSFGMDTTQTLPVGISVGDQAPVFFANDITGATVNSKELYKKGPVVVVFYRGEWCPVCNRYLAELNDSLPAISELGATVLVVSPELVQNAMETKKNTESNFVFISDRSLEIGRGFDVMFSVTEAYQTKVNTKLEKDIASSNGADEAMLPVPATFVMDTNGKVVYKQFDYNYRNRASATDIFEAVSQARQ